MSTNESNKEMEVMVLVDLAAICKKLAETSAVPQELRVKAGQFVEEFNSLLPIRGAGNWAQQAQGEWLLTRIARFLPSVIVHSEGVNHVESGRFVG